MNFLRILCAETFSKPKGLAVLGNISFLFFIQFFLYFIYLIFFGSYWLSASREGEIIFYYNKVDSFIYMAFSITFLVIFSALSFLVSFSKTNKSSGNPYKYQYNSKYLWISAFCIIFSYSEILDGIYEIGGIFSKNQRATQSLFVASQSIEYYFYFHAISILFFIIRKLKNVFSGEAFFSNLPNGHVFFLKRLQKADFIFFITIILLFVPTLWWTKVPMEKIQKSESVPTYECTVTQQECDTRGQNFVSLSLFFFIAHIAFIRWQILRAYAAQRLLLAGHDISNPQTWGTRLLPTQNS